MQTEPYTSIRRHVIETLTAKLPEMQARFGIETIGIFGSVARGEDTPDSDIDILYLFREGKGSMSTVVPLMEYLKGLFGRDVDLISLNYISPLIESYVKADAIICNGNKAEA